MVFPLVWSLVCLPDIPKRLMVRNQHLTFFSRLVASLSLVGEQLSAENQM